MAPSGLTYGRVQFMRRRTTPKPTVSSAAQAFREREAIVIVREQALSSSFLEIRRRGVLGRDHRLQVGGEVEAHARIERIDTTLPCRVVRLRAQIDRGRVVLERDETVPEPLAQVHGVA